MPAIRDANIDGVVYLIEPTLYIAPTLNNAAYTASLGEFTLIPGVTVHAKFTATNIDNATLNINNTGAKYIFYNNARITAGAIKPNHTYTLTFDGVQWQLVGDLNTNTQEAYGNISTSGTLAAANQAVVTDANKKVTSKDMSSTLSDITAESTGANTFIYGVTQDGQGKVTVTTRPLALAANNTRGGIQIGYNESGQNYAVKLSGEKAYVTVPLTSTEYGGNALTTGYRWNAVTQGQKWSRICLITPTVNVEGSSGILSVSCTRGNVVNNATFFITASHSSKCFITALSTTSYTATRIRGVVNSGGTAYIELYDTGNSIAVGTAQTWHCTYIPILSSTVTTYTVFTDGTTIPSNYTVVNEFTAPQGNDSAPIVSINRSGTTFTATRANGTSFTFSQQDNNTTYTFTGGTNSFTVTPLGGTAQTVTVTPSITNNITGTGTANRLTKFTGANTIGSTGITIDNSNNLTVPGTITLSTAPTANSHAVTKQYVDNSTMSMGVDNGTLMVYNGLNAAANPTQQMPNANGQLF